MIHRTVHGTRVPALGFGTWALRGDECRTSVADALALGYRHIDTAQGYANEEEVGAAIAASDVPRDDIFLVSKVRPSNFRHDDVIASTHESLRKLQVEHVDLMLLHWPNFNVPLAETLGAMNELQDAGAIEHIGVSNFPPSMTAEATQTSTIFANQVEYHPYLHQRFLLEQAEREDYLLTAYCPIARGRVLDDPALKEIGAAHGKSTAQVTLRWLVQQERVAAIPKAASAEHRRANFAIFDFELSDDEMARIHGLERELRLMDEMDELEWERG